MRQLQPLRRELIEMGLLDNRIAEAPQIPIPEIVGENTDDPELLGVPEHVPAGKGPEATVPKSPQDR